MIQDKTPGSVWNVAFVAVAVFLAVIALSGIVSPGEIAAVASGK